MKSITAAAAVAASIASAPAVAENIEIRHSEAANVFVGKPDNFTGTAEVRLLMESNESTRSNVALVDFAPTARTTWHSHPAGQMLLVTAGTGWIQEDGKARRVIKGGDVVWIPAGVKHWHGATDKTPMSHVALTYMRDGKNVDWLEPVSDEQYR